MHNESEELKAKIVKMNSSIQDYEKKLESFKNLDSRIKAYEHCSRAQCIELNGIEFTQGEDLSEAFHRILKHQKIDSISATHDIDKIYRIKRSKRVIIKFVQSYKRDQFFNVYRKNIMDTSMIGFKDKSKIYVNGVLSANQRELFWKARKFKQSHNYIFIWTHNQKIYLRKSADSSAVQINNEAELENLACV